jgi:hypothetical protein
MSCAQPHKQYAASNARRQFCLNHGPQSCVLRVHLTTLPATASCCLQASPNHHNDSVPYRILGNTTVAQNGTAAFTGLVVNGKPGDTVTLVFRTQVGERGLLGTGWT